MTDTLLILATFALIALAARQIGTLFTRLHLPLITGFLITGVLAGPYVLDLITLAQVHELVFLDELALAFIAFVAGSELYIDELRSRLRSIGYITAGIVLFTVVLATTAFLVLGERIPFVSALTPSGRFGVALLAGTILVARSPSSAIAVINEVRARGPFTRTALGVTVIMDVIVIVLFAFSIAVADLLLKGVALGPGVIALLGVELATIVLLGAAQGQILRWILATRLARGPKTAFLLAVGYLAFVVSGAIREFSDTAFGTELLLEPLLICLIASYVVINHTRHRAEFIALLQWAAPAVFVVFFALVGASLELDVLVAAWPIALALFAVRIVAIAIGAYVGGTVAGDPPRHNRLRWMAFVTQAGVALGLAQEVAVEFPIWGAEFATLIIALVVLNETIGPPLFKGALRLVGEAHGPAAPGGVDGVQRALIVGVDDQSRTLARQLAAHGWQVTVGCLTDPQRMPALATAVETARLPALSRAGLAAAGAERADAIVALLTDDENYRIAELAFEQFGTRRVVIRLNQMANAARFQALGAMVVEPGTAVVGLLEQFVRSPIATSLLLGMAGDQDVRTLELANPHVAGLRLRELHLPEDILILSVQRDGHTIISHGYTRLQLGDEVTALGAPASLDALALRLAGD